MKLRTLAGVASLATIGLSTIALAGPFDGLKQAATADLQQAVTNSTAQTTSSLKGAATAAALTQIQNGSFKLGSAQNVAGVLGYCEKQGLAPSTTQTIKGQLMNKLGLPEQSNNSSYQQGLSGVLQGAQGGNFNLSSLKQALGKRICKAIANKAASSLL
ncbi:MAG TPA: DUF2501 domain-containing protein [Nevskiaceae bacterium]|nr:DUF2501 domain-containing protein [Nevskiaceae bacterium]